jgi:glutaryl-CoA dehydrogenase
VSGDRHGGEVGSTGGTAGAWACDTEAIMSDLSSSRPDPADFLGVDHLLSDEERLIRDTVRDYVADRIAPEVAAWWEEGTIPHAELAKEMGSLGLFGMHLDGYGCAGVSNVAYGLACRELEAGDSGIRSFVSVQGSLAMFPIWRFGSEEQKQEWLPRMAAGEAIGCFGLTEADSGSDPASMKTHARRDGSDWVLNGSKMWITNGSIADVAVIWARTDEGIRGFVVPTDTKGFSAPLIHHKASLRASVTSELVFDDVRLPDAFALPGVASMRGPLSCLNEARFGIAWGAVGAARACYEAALAYAGERVQFGVPIASFQLTQQKLVDMMVKVNRGALVSLHLGRMKDEGTLTPEHISFGKMDNARTALEVARTARSILGGNGITLEYPVFRHMANLETVYTYEGTNEIHTLILGNALTGIPAFQA